MAQQTIRDDIKRSKKTIRVVSCTADMSYWTDEILNLLERKKEKNPALDIEFLVGPKLSNGKLEELVKNEVLSLYQLSERPPCDCRIIDDCSTYTSNHGIDGGKRNFLWTFANIKAVRDRKKYYNKLKKEVV